MYSEDGTITLVPKIADPFRDEKVGAFYEEDVWVDFDEM